MKKIVLYRLLLCLVGSIPLAQDAYGQRDPKTRREVIPYLVKNVLPVKKEQRLLLDRQMSAADRKQLEQLRQDLDKLRQDLLPI